MQNVSGKSGWKVNETRLFRVVPQKNSGSNETSEKVVRLFQAEFRLGYGTQNSGLVNFVPEFHLPCTNLRLIRSMTVIFFADSNRFRVHQAKFEPNTWGRPILMAQSIPSIPFTNPTPPPLPRAFAAFSFPKQNDKCPTNARQMPGPRLELTEPLDLNTIIPYSLLDLQAPVPGKPIIANTGLNIAWNCPSPQALGSNLA